MFKRAIKEEAKLRLALAGPSGSGKTFTALTLGTALGKRVAVIDTEHGSASKYADQFPEFDVLELEKFNPESYVEAIHAAATAGYDVLIIDSLSHAWSGPGGILEMVETVAERSKSGNKFQAWSKVTPLHNKLIDSITRADLHVIATMRSKQEYLQTKNDDGKTEIKKVGTTPVQRDGMEYEFDIFGEMDIYNNLLIQKSRCSELAGKSFPRPDTKVVTILQTWLQGAPRSAPTAPRTAPEVPLSLELPSGPALLDPDAPATLEQKSQYRKLYLEKKGIEAPGHEVAQLSTSEAQSRIDLLKTVKLQKAF